MVDMASMCRKAPKADTTAIARPRKAPRKVLSDAVPPEDFLSPKEMAPMVLAASRRRARRGAQVTPKIREDVRTLAEHGVPFKIIASVVGVSYPELAKKCMGEFARGRDVASVGIIKTLYLKALNGDNACLIYWCKTQLGWKDSVPVQKVDLVSSDGSMSPKAAGTPLTLEDLDRLESLCDKLEPHFRGDVPPSGGLLS